MGLMHEKVQKLTRTTLPRGLRAVKGCELSHSVAPLCGENRHPKAIESSQETPHWRTRQCLVGQQRRSLPRGRECGGNPFYFLLTSISLSTNCGAGYFCVFMN